MRVHQAVGAAGFFSGKAEQQAAPQRSEEQKSCNDQGPEVGFFRVPFWGPEVTFYRPSL